MDVIEGPVPDPDSPLRMPIINKFQDMGTIVMGRIESGSLREGVSLIIMPNKTRVKVTAIYIGDEMENIVTHADLGENVRVRLSGIEEEDILSGYVLSSISKPIAAINKFTAQLHIHELGENAIFSAGYNAILHIHSAVEQCEIVDLLQQIDLQTRLPKRKKPLFVKSGAVVVCRIRVNNLISVEKFSDFPRLGRFTLRREGKTLADGKIVELSPVA